MPKEGVDKTRAQKMKEVKDSLDQVVSKELVKALVPNKNLVLMERVDKRTTK